MFRSNTLPAALLLLTLGWMSGPAFGQTPATVEKEGSSIVASDDGIRVTNARKNVLFGNVKRSKTPSIVDYKKALAATPEVRKIRDDGVDKNSAQYAILLQKAVKRLKKMIRSVAIAESRDCVIKKGAIRSKGDADIVDITSQVVSELESADLD